MSSRLRKRVGGILYVCTRTATVPGIIQGEVDFLAGAKTKVDAMLERAKERARQGASARR